MRFNFLSKFIIVCSLSAGFLGFHFNHGAAATRLNLYPRGPSSSLQKVAYPHRNPLEAKFEQFIDQVAGGQSAAVRGVFVDDVLQLPVIQQPKEDPVFVSPEMGKVTQFNSPARNGITALLAHNYLSGQSFYSLTLGQEVKIVYGDGSYRRYRITEMDRFQKLEPRNARSAFLDLETGQRLSHGELYAREYSGDHRVVFQTCIEKDGEWSWGLIFITAAPIAG